MKTAEEAEAAAKEAEAPAQKIAGTTIEGEVKKEQGGLRHRVRSGPGASAPNAATPVRRGPHPAMFDIGFSEIMVIAVVALVVLGPEKLPKTARTLGHLFGRLQRYVSDVKADINRELELDELRKLQGQVQSAAKEIETSMVSAQQEIRSNVGALESELNAAGTGQPVNAATAPAPAEPAMAAAPAVRRRRMRRPLERRPRVSYPRHQRRRAPGKPPRQASLPGFERD